MEQMRRQQLELSGTDASKDGVDPRSGVQAVAVTAQQRHRRAGCRHARTAALFGEPGPAPGAAPQSTASPPPSSESPVPAAAEPGLGQRPPPFPPPPPPPCCGAERRGRRRGRGPAEPPLRAAQQVPAGGGAGLRERCGFHRCELLYVSFIPSAESGLFSFFNFFFPFFGRGWCLGLWAVAGVAPAAGAAAARPRSLSALRAARSRCLCPNSSRSAQGSALPR